MSEAVYTARRHARSHYVNVRNLRYHANIWGDAASVTPARPPLVMLHGWMDVGISFQFIVDALRDDRYVIAPDWRGFGHTDTPPNDSYWFADYLGDLDGLLDALMPGQAVDLVGHSMGGNVSMLYAGVRPHRIRRLVNMEGFGMPDMPAEQAPQRLSLWLQQLKAPAELKSFASLADVAARLCKTNPRLPADRAAWLAPRWSRQDAEGRYQLLADPHHKHPSAVLYRKDEALASWRRIVAPVLWIEGDETDTSAWWGNRYPRADFDERMTVVQKLERFLVSPSGHMLHHNQPQALADRITAFLD